MATKKTAQKNTTKEGILATYMNSTLENGQSPISVFKFCKENGFEESDFYKHFGSLEAVQKHVWTAFFENTEAVAAKTEGYNGYSNREKMLAFFYSFFEVLTLNRSYVLFALKEHKNMLKNLEQLGGLRKKTKEFATALIDEKNAEKQFKLTKHSPELFSEGAWLQLLFLLKFWMDDSSASFEKTDVAIEKSVNTIFDVFDNTPLDSLLDFGKFLWKEKMV